MAAPKKSSGDPLRVLRLLWRGQAETPSKPRQGPPPSLSVTQMVTQAIVLADTEGLGALTLRRLAQELGVATMSLYTYVANKAELLELMIDAAYLELPEGEPPSGDWRRGVQALAQINFDFYQRHAWMLELDYAEKPPLGPGVMGKYERELGVFANCGLSDLEMDAALTFVLNFVRSAARDAVAARLSAKTAPPPEQWWQAQADAFQALLPPGAFPLSERVGAAAGAFYGGAANAAFAYEFGLQRVLDGLAQLIQDRPSRS